MIISQLKWAITTYIDSIEWIHLLIYEFRIETKILLRDFLLGFLFLSTKVHRSSLASYRDPVMFWFSLRKWCERKRAINLMTIMSSNVYSVYYTEWVHGTYVNINKIFSRYLVFSPNTEWNENLYLLFTVATEGDRLRKTHITSEKSVQLHTVHTQHPCGKRHNLFIRYQNQNCSRLCFALIHF